MVFVSLQVLKYFHQWYFGQGRHLVAICTQPHLHEGLRGRHLQGRHGDLHVANGDLEHQVWSPFGRHSDLTFASGDHMQSPKLLLVATWSPWRPRVTSGDIGRFFIRLLLKHNAAHTQSSLFSNSLNSKAVART